MPPPITRSVPRMPSTVNTFRDVACTVCGCVCDDLVIEIDAERVTPRTGSCCLADPWFATLNDAAPSATTIEGRFVSLAEALDRASQLLATSRSPLVFGLSRSSTAGQRAAVELGESLGATIDTTASVCHGPSIMAIQQVGESTSTLGEISNRADLVMFWGADPATSHPRHFERYSLEPQGLFVPRGRADRHLIVVDDQTTATTDLADTFLKIPTGSDFEVIAALRLLIAGERLDDSFQSVASLEQLRAIATRLCNCRYGVVFFGLGLAQRGLGHANVEVLLRLVEELNHHTRFTARRLRIPGDVTGADAVLCWRTGYPFAVNMARGYPRYNPGEYSANELLERREVDSCLLVGSESVPSLSPQAQSVLRELPTISLDYPNHRPAFTPTVQFTTAIYGLHAPGTAYRMDEVPIPLRQLMPSPYPTDDQILQQIAERFESCRRGTP